MSIKKSEQNLLSELGEFLKSKSSEELIKEHTFLSSMINKLPRFIWFFEEIKILGYTFSTEENRYEIIGKSNNNYIVKDRNTNYIVPLPKNLEEKAYVEGGSFDLNY